MKNNLKYILLITALVFAVYANALHNDFVSDDLPAILNNPDIAHPFAALSIASFSNSINYFIGGFNPFGYHLLNLILHALNSVMVFFLLRLFFKAMPSFWGALVFALHPVQAEAVAWASGRPYLLFTFFLLLSFFCYLSAAPNKKFGRYACSLFFYACALLASFFPLAFAPLIALYDIAFGRWRKTWKLWPAFFALAAVKILLMLTLVQQRVVELALDSGVRSWSNPFFNLVYSFFAHLWLVIWPVKLTLYHEPSVISSLGLKLEIFLFALIVLSLPLLYKKAKPVFFAACLYILFLCPTYSPVMIAWLVAERYLYFAMISYSIIAAFLIDRYVQCGKLKETASSVIARSSAEGGTTKQSKNRDCFASLAMTRTALIYIFLTVLVAAYALRSIVRNRDWRTHSSLWKATVKVSPQSPKAHNNMGDVYSLEGDWNKAAAEFRRAIELKPDYAEAYHNLGNSYLNLGRQDEAALAYQQAIAYRPGLYQSQANLGFVYLQKGQRELARRHLGIAARLAPNDTIVRDLLKQVQ